MFRFGVFKKLTIAFILLAAFFIGMHILAFKSEPYSVAIKYIENSQSVKKYFGEINDARLALFGYSMNYRGIGGNAQFEIKIRSNTHKGTMYVFLVRKVGVWDVSRANLKIGGETIIQLK